MTDQEFDELAIRVEALPLVQRVRLAEHILAGVRQAITPPAPVEEPWTEEEVRAMLSNNHPKTLHEIAQSPLVGAWADMGIEDSVQWVEEQRAKRRYTW